jgi:putative transposase
MEIGAVLAERSGMAGHGAPRLTSFAYRGFAAYSVTCCTFGRRPLFTEERCVEDVSGQLLQQASAYRFDVPAYCFMPDHVHVLFEATAADNDFRRLMNTWKQQTGYLYKRATGSRLWQSGYFDHILRQDEDRLKVIAYLLGNPLRARLAERIDDYPFWGSGVWSRDSLIEAVQDRITAAGRAG